MRKALILAVVALCAGVALGQVESASDLERGKIFAGIGDWENGLKLLEPYILQNPKDAEARLLLAECYFNFPDMEPVSEGGRQVDRNKARGEAQIRILGNLGEEGFQMLLRGLYSDTRDVHRRCMAQVERKKDRRAIDDLIRVVEEKPERGHSAVYTLVAIEEGGQKVEERVAKLLNGLLEGPETGGGLRRSAARGVAVLRIREAIPAVKKELERIRAELPTMARDSRRLDDTWWELIYLVEAMVILSPQDSEAEIEKVFSAMDRPQASEFFRFSENRVDELSSDSIRLLSTAALEMMKSAPDVGRWNTRKLLRRVARVYPQILREPNMRKQLHDACDSHLREVREVAIEILGEVADEDSLDFLLGKLQAGEDGAWGNPESERIWWAISEIASPKTNDFLLEKLESQDLAWVTTAARLLAEMRDLRAVELLEKRYSELPSGETSILRGVRSSIESSYRKLTGRPISGGMELEVAPEAVVEPSGGRR